MPQLHTQRSQVLKNVKYQISKYQTLHIQVPQNWQTFWEMFSAPASSHQQFTALKLAMLAWSLPSVTTQIYHTVHKNGKTGMSCSLFQSRYLTGMLLYAQTLLNFHQKLLTTFGFGVALKEAWGTGANWMQFVSESTLQNTLIMSHRVEFGKHARDQVASGYSQTREASLASNSWRYPHFWSFAVSHIWCCTSTIS